MGHGALADDPPPCCCGFGHAQLDEARAELPMGRPVRRAPQMPTLPPKRADEPMTSKGLFYTVRAGRRPDDQRALQAGVPRALGQQAHARADPVACQAITSDTGRVAGDGQALFRPRFAKGRGKAP